MSNEDIIYLSKLHGLTFSHSSPAIVLLVFHTFQSFVPISWQKYVHRGFTYCEGNTGEIEPSLSPLF